MVIHAVFVRVHERSVEKAEQVVAALKPLGAKVDGVTKWEVGVNALGPTAGYDLALISEFESGGALDIYRDHREHVAVLGVIRPLIESSTIVDLES